MTAMLVIMVVGVSAPVMMMMMMMMMMAVVDVGVGDDVVVFGGAIDDDGVMVEMLAVVGMMGRLVVVIKHVLTWELPSEAQPKPACKNSTYMERLLCNLQPKLPQSKRGTP